jgi:hypothetical protein
MDLAIPWTGWTHQDGGKNVKEMAKMCKEKKTSIG